MATLHENVRSVEKQHVAIDATGSTSLGTVGRDWYPREVILILTEAPSAIGLCTISIGTNSSSYNNILSSTLLLNLSAVNTALKINLLNSSTITSMVPANTEIFVKVSIAATLGGEVHVICDGFYADYVVDD